MRTSPLIIAILLAALPARAEVPTATEMMSKAAMRERLAACATEWQAMKRAGADAGLIWREYSKSCMARRSKQTSAPSK